jgi:regulator of protease activity HflC (stomatin/prohibitin superfamily)
MVGFIFGIIFLIAGIIAAVCLAQYKRVEKTEEYVLDEEGNRMRSSYGGYRTTTKETVTKPLAKFSVVSVVAGVFLAILLTFFGCISSVDTGHVGVVKTFGKVEDYTFDSGFHLKAPWNSVTQINNQVQKTTIELPCFSKDIQEVNTTYTVNYQIAKGNAQNLYRDIGVNYLDTVVNPTIQETVKTIIAKYSAEDLIGKRAIVAAEIEELLRTNLQKYNIDVSSTAIENMDFTDSFTNAVEAKVVAEQQKIQAKTEQERLTMEAEKAAERAQIEATAQAAVDKTKAEAAAKIAEIQAEADAKVAEISANAAEYQGKKEAAIALQRLASINGWTVVTETVSMTVRTPVYRVDKDGKQVPDANGNPIVDYVDVIETKEVHTLYKADGTKVNETELKEGTQKLIEYYYTQSWDGKLPDTFVGDGDISNIIVGTN